MKDFRFRDFANQPLDYGANYHDWRIRFWGRLKKKPLLVSKTALGGASAKNSVFGARAKNVSIVRSDTWVPHPRIF